MPRRKLGFWKRGAAMVCKPLMVTMEKPTWQGMENLPATGPVIVVANHLSHYDPFTLAHFVYDAGRWPVFLAKASLFKLPVLGKWLSLVDQTPVARGTVDAAKALDAAVLALKNGQCVLIYPEGSTTKEPDLWPMRGKTGAARLWLSTHAPVVPIVMWGPQQVFDPRNHKLRPVPRRPMTVVAGRPVDLGRWEGAEATTATLTEITEHLMLVLRDMLAEVRGVPAPPLFHPLFNPLFHPNPTSDTSAPSAPSSTSEV